MTVKPRILHVVRPTSGGIRTHLSTLLPGLKDRSYHISLASGSEEVEEFTQRGIPTRWVPIADGLKPVSDMQAVLSLHRVVREASPDIIHAHGFKAGLISGMVLPTRARFIMTVHNYHAWGQGTGFAGRFFRQAGRKFLRRVDGFITVSEALKTYLTDSLGIGGNRIFTIYNGIDPQLYLPPCTKSEARRAFGFEQDSFLIGTVARLVKEKGLEHLIYAASILRARDIGAQVAVAGDGPLMSELEQRIAALGLQDTVVLLGFQADLPRFLAALDLFVLPSVSEGLGISLLEAMAGRVPVAAAASGGIPEVVIDGVTGLTAPPGDSRALAVVIERLYREPDLARKLAGNAWARVNERFSRKHMIEETARVYEAVLGGRESWR